MEENTSELIIDVRGSRNTEPTVNAECVSRYFDVEGYLVVEHLFNDVCMAIENHCGHLPIGEVKED